MKAVLVICDGFIDYVLCLVGGASSIDFFSLRIQRSTLTLYDTMSEGMGISGVDWSLG